MTPCEKKGYEVGDWFTVLDTEFFFKDSIVELIDDDNSPAPYFQLIKGGETGLKSVFDKHGSNVFVTMIVKVAPIYKEQKKVETIELMGKTYNKAEIEEALSNVLPV